MFTKDSASAPASTQAKAISLISSALGDSFTIIGFFETSLQALTTSSADSHFIPNAIPPVFTLGQEIFSSIKSILVSFNSLTPSR